MTHWRFSLPQLPQKPEVDLPLCGITIAFGESGCGKTRLLRALAGLDRTAGEIQFGQRFWQSPQTFLPPAQRNIGMMFQESRLLPHKTVAENIFLGQEQEAAPHIIDALDLSALLNKKAAHLSGGEQRRCALARALVHEGDVLFLDEPLTGLDSQRRGRALALIKAAAEKKPVLMVTHQLDELLQLADQLLLMNEQTLVSGTLDQLINHPILVQQRGHAFSIVRGNTHEKKDGLTQLALDDGQHIRLAGSTSTQSQAIAIDARDVSIALSHAQDSSILNILRAQIVSLGDITGNYATVEMALGQQTLRALVSTHSIRLLGLSEGQWVYAQIKGTVQI